MSKKTRERARKFLDKSKGVMRPSQFNLDPVYYETNVVTMIENAIIAERKKKG